jgi:hypothetical protein
MRCLGAIALVACAHPAYLAFPDAGRGRVAFSPDGHAYAIADGQLSAWELGDRRRLWARPVDPADDYGLAFSPAGAFVVLVEKRGDGAIVDELDASGGRQVAALTASAAGIDGARLARRVAATDDGQVLAIASHEGAVDVYDQGARTYRDPLRRQMASVAAAPVGHRFAFATDAGGIVKVIAEDGAVWTEAATFEDAAAPSWTPAGGLAFATGAGLELWDGTARRVLVPGARAIDGEPAWAIGPAGEVATWSAARLELRDRAGKVVFTSDDGVRAGAFAGGRFAAYLRSGDVLVVDVADPAHPARRPFGAPGAYLRDPSSGATIWQEAYAPLLSTDGRFLDEYRDGRGHVIEPTR